MQGSPLAMDLTTRIPHRRSKPRLPAPLLIEKPIITVEKSFEISFDYSPTNLDYPIDHTSPPLDESRIQPSLVPSAIYRAAAAIGRPSTARDKVSYDIDHNDPVCPSPIVMTSQDKMSSQIDVHEALRSQLPPLRQSKRWAKTYLNQPESHNLLKGTETLSERSHVVTPNTSQPKMAVTAADTFALSDNESEHHGLCRPAHVPGWQAFKRHRSVKHPTISTKACKGLVSSSPKRMKSSKSIRSRFAVEARRTVLPKSMQDKKIVLEQQNQFSPSISGRWRRRKAHDKSQQSSISTLYDPVAECSENRPNSPTSSLHNYEKVTRFSAECVSMLSRLDFGEAWRLSVLGPSLCIHPAPSAEPAHVESREACKQPEATRGDPVLLVDDSGERSGLRTFNHIMQKPVHRSESYGDDQSLCESKLEENTSSDRLTKIAVVLNEAMDTESGDCLPNDMPVITKKSSKSSFHRPTTRMASGNLKPARSVDTLTEIEAQVGDVLTSSNHELERKGSTFTLHSTPKRQRPSGQPPGGPLPDLPGDDASDSRSTLHHRPSFASSYKSGFIRNALEIPDPFGLFLLQNTAHLPSLLPNPSAASSIKSVKQLDRMVIHKKEVTNALPIHGTVNRPIVIEDAAIPRPCDTRSLPGSHIPRTSILVERMENNIGTTQNTGNGMVTSRTLPALHLRSDFGPLPPIPIRNGLLHVVPNSKHSQKLTRTTSRTSLSSARRSELKQKKPKQVASSPNLQQSSRANEKPKQKLSRSQIMVVVDTNPHTASFRAGALSPSPSMRCSRSRSTSPSYRGTKTKSLKSSQIVPNTSDHRSSVEEDNLAELIDIVRPPASDQKKRSYRGLRAQTSARSLLAAVVRSTSDSASPTPAIFRGYVKPAVQCGLDSSGSDLEDSPLIRSEQLASTPTKRNVPRANVRRSHVRQDTPLTKELKEEVKRANLELDNLKKYEQRIEYLQLHLDQTLKVWGRMSQNGKRQYLASTFGDVDKKHTPRSKAPFEDNNTTSIASSSTYSTRSSVQKLDANVSKSLREAVDFVKNASTECRRVSETSSSVTRTETETDTDTSYTNPNDTLNKRASEGSLTDYDLPTSIDNSKPEAEALGANLDAFRARLQATRPPAIPSRRWKVRSSPRTRARIDGSAHCLERYGAEPWDRQADDMRRTDISSSISNGNSSDEDHNRLSLERETLRTDQMDALLLL